MIRFGKYLKDNMTEQMALAIKYTVSEEDEYIRTIHTINKEMFIRYHRPAARFSKVVLLSVGDTKKRKGIVDYSKTAIYLPIECSPVNDSTFSTLEENRLWIIMLSMFRSGELTEVYRFSIDKETEFIRDRDLIIL